MADSSFESNRPQRRAWLWLALWGLIALLAYVVIIEHRNHALSFLPYVLLLVCPFMHVFGHGRHGRHRHHHRHHHSHHHGHYEGQQRQPDSRDVNQQRAPK